MYLQFAATGVKHDFVQRRGEMLEHHEGRGQGGVTAQIYFGQRSEPAQRIAVLTAHQKGGSRQAPLMNSLSKRITLSFLGRLLRSLVAKEFAYKANAHRLNPVQHSHQSHVV